MSEQTVDANAKMTAIEIAADAPPPPVVLHQLDISMATIAKVLGTLVAVWLVVELKTVLLILLLSLLLVATFNPLVRRLQRRFTRRGALTLVIVGILAAVALPVSLVVPLLFRQVASFVTELPTYLQSLQALLAHHGIPSANLAQGTQNVVSTVTQGLPQVFGVLTNVMHLVVEALTVVILAIYLLIEGPEVGQEVLRILPRERRLEVRRLLSDVGSQVGAYVRGQLILSACAGTCFALILFALGIPNALALAVVAAVVDCIPIFGVFIALVPACLTALSISSFKAVLVLVCYGVYHELETNVLAPRVFGQTLGMNISIVLLSILVGVELLGVVGAVLALPVAAALPILLRYLWALHDEMTATPVVEEQPAGQT